MNDNLVKLENVKVEYNTKYQKVSIFDNLNLSVQKNDYLVVMGKSGSGKSTILNIISGFLLPQSGKVLVEGDDILEYSPSQINNFRNKKIGYIFQSFNLIYQLSVVENVMVPMLISGENKKKAKERATSLLSKVGLSDRLDHFPNQLSGGEQQRVGIARALANNPDIIIADEPTGNLDAATGNSVLDILDEIHNQGKTIILVTHDEDIVNRATRVINMKDLKN